MLRAFFLLSLLTNLNAESKMQADVIESKNWQASTFLEAPILPMKDPEFIAPVIDAAGAISVDIASGEILYGQNVHLVKPIASLTKLMTAVIILEENDLNEVVTISSEASKEEGSQIYLKMGEKIHVRDLMYALLVASANDAAYSLAEYNAGSVEQFVEKMNKKAKIMGLYNTHFSNPVGLDDSDNFSSPYDLAILGRYAYRKPFFANAVKYKSMTIKSLSGISHNLENTNKILGGFLNIEGIKTGKTTEAGLCLIAIGSNKTGNKVLTIVLDSPDRFKETKILMDWSFRAYKW